MALSSGNIVLSAAGLALAASAAAFAAVMIANSGSSPRGVNGIEHLAIFAQPAANPPMRTVTRQPGPAAVPDPVTVGSIRPKAVPAPGASSSAAVAQRAAPVRGLYDGKALVEVPSGLALVEPGTRQPQVGETLAVTSRNGRWVVVDADDGQ